MENVKQKALEEVTAFLERAGEDKNVFIAKVQVQENVLTCDYEKDETITSHEVSVVLLAKTPKGLEVAYNNVISLADSLTEDQMFEKIEQAFPTAEEIEASRKQAEEERKKREEFQKQMEQINPAGLAKAAAEAASIPGDEEAVNTEKNERSDAN